MQRAARGPWPLHLSFRCCSWPLTAVSRLPTPACVLRGPACGLAGGASAAGDPRSPAGSTERSPRSGVREWSCAHCRPLTPALMRRALLDDMVPATLPCLMWNAACVQPCVWWDPTTLLCTSGLPCYLACLGCLHPLPKQPCL